MEMTLRELSCLLFVLGSGRRAVKYLRVQIFLDLEQRWLFLARSYEFTQRLTEFFDETKLQNR